MKQAILLSAGALTALLALATHPIAAEELAPSFKRLKVGEQKLGKRITIQIDPAEDYYRNPPKAAAKESVGAVLDVPKLPDSYARFWNAISPKLDDAGPGRLEAALAALRDAPEISGPRLDHIRRITDAYGTDILRMTLGTKVSPALVAAIISVESSGRVDAVSSAGARGLMQLMPATAERFGVEDISSPGDNIRGGVAYLDWLTGHFDHDPLMILAGYNAGEGAVAKHAGVPPFAETRAYVPKVLAAWKVAAGLCRTPPQLLSDGCVFLTGG